MGARVGVAIVAALIAGGPHGEWSAAMLAASEPVAPHLMTLVHEDLLELPVTLVAFAPFAPRAWELRGTLSSYDAWHVAIAVALDVEVMSLDSRLTRAPGITCRVRSALDSL